MFRGPIKVGKFRTHNQLSELSVGDHLLQTLTDVFAGGVRQLDERYRKTREQNRLYRLSTRKDPQLGVCLWSCTLFKMGGDEVSVNNMSNHANVTYFCPYHTEIGNSFFSLHYP